MSRKAEAWGEPLGVVDILVARQPAVCRLMATNKMMVLNLNFAKDTDSTQNKYTCNSTYFMK